MWNGARILLECLKREGVQNIFGYPGAVIIDVYHDLPNHKELKHILVRHEQGAVHAADGYARASGQVGVCLVTSGPGATNTVTGIANANADSIPLVVFCGQVPTGMIGNDAFQEVDILGITRPCSKHNMLVKDVKDLALTIRQAFYIARSGRPGPVVVDLPKDVIQGLCEFKWPEEVRMRSYNPHYTPNTQQVKKAVKLLCEAKKPLILAGGGIAMSDASKALIETAHHLNAPVIGTLMGLGSFPSSDPLWLGMVGMHGSYTANMALSNADVLLAVGARFDDRVTGRINSFAPNATIIHVDIDPTSIHKNIPVRIPLVADCKQALEAIYSYLQKDDIKKDWENAHNDWFAQIKDWKDNNKIAWKKDSKHLKPQEVIQTLRSFTTDDTIITTEVGQHQMWTAQYYGFAKSRTLITSGGLGTMGFGLPAAIGAQIAKPEALVIDIAGDGSIQMNSQEIMTAVQYGLPVKVLILNNGYLGMVRQWQELFFDKQYSGTVMDFQPDFVKLAEAYGAEGYRITNKEELLSLLPKALASKKMAIIDVRVEPEENVYPMVPAGAAINEMLIV